MITKSELKELRRKVSLDKLIAVLVIAYTVSKKVCLIYTRSNCQQFIRLCHEIPSKAIRCVLFSLENWAYFHYLRS